MTTYFLSPDGDTDKVAGLKRQLRAELPELRELSSIEALVEAVSDKAAERSVVLIAASAKDSGLLARVVDLAGRFRDRAYFILISDDIAANDYKRLVRTGGADWVSTSAVPQEVLDILSRRRPGIESHSGPRTGPVVVSFAPCAGGVGNTTIAVEVATQLKIGKATRDRKICIVDLDVQSSHVCDHLDIEPRLQIQEIAGSPERLDEQLFDIFISRHDSGLHVIAAPRSKFDACEVGVDALDALFDMISRRYDLVLVDLPVTWFKWTPHVIAASDAVIVTGINTIPGLRQIAETVTAVRDARRPGVDSAIAVNRCGRRMLGGIERRHHIEKVLGREKTFFVGEDPMLVRAINAGTPLAISDPGSKASKEVAALAGYCAAVRSTRTPA
jgi:pilus assembly protein CpaE